jgi:GT2 family glycosyltransferase
MTQTSPSVGFVVRSHNEAPRLRLTLASLAAQTWSEKSEALETVVVDDGSSDDTAEVIAAAKAKMRLTCVRHAHAKGRSAAANAGAEVATTDILLFLDGDTLAGPNLAASHAEAHAKAGNEGALLVGRGETWHLRCTRFLADPESGAPMPGQDHRIAALPPAELARMRVTREQIVADFGAIDRRAAPGIYPGAGPRALYESEMVALRDASLSPLHWAAACGANLSVPRAAFVAVGGFDEQIDINEHRELAFRLCAQGARMRAVEGARSYHMTHRVGWRDPLEERGWEARFRLKHPDAPITLLKRYWAGFSDRAGPGSIRSLKELALAAQAEA